jgi:DNA-binding NtrC family response regulator
MSHLRILVVDDDPIILSILDEALTKAKYEVDQATDGSNAVQFISHNYFDVVITDLKMPGELDGIDVLEAAKSKSTDTEVFILTGYAEVDSAVTAMKKGAADFLQKPIRIDELYLRLKRIENLKALEQNAKDLREAMDVTEENARESIRTMEELITNLEHKLDQIKQILSDEDADAYLRVHKALGVLS